MKQTKVIRAKLAAFDWDGHTLSFGSHPNGTATCARELIYYARHGTIKDRTPDCMTASLAVLPRLNDAFGDDRTRTAVIGPFLRELALCPRDPQADQERAFALADYAVRIIAKVSCARIVDADTARTGQKAAATAYAAAVAYADAVAYAAATAYAVAAAYAAAAVAAADANAADAAARTSTITGHTRALLQIIIAF